MLRLRWRQQNSLKYLVEEYPIDQLIQYEADAAPDARQDAPDSAQAAGEAGDPAA